MEISGKIIVVCEAKSGVSNKTGNPWKAQDYVIETIEDNPNSFVFNVFGEEKIKNFDLKAGDNVKVDVHFEAREYNGRWFNSLSAINVKKSKAKKVKIENDSSDELPF